MEERKPTLVDDDTDSGVDTRVSGAGTQGGSGAGTASGSGTAPTETVSERARRRFLTSTAITLTESRISELNEMKAIVDKLGLVVSKLNDVRMLIESMNELQATLEAKLHGELHTAIGWRNENAANAMDLATFVPGDLRNFTKCLDEIRAMLLA